MTGTARQRATTPELLQNLGQIEARIQTAPLIGLFLDFDGTISPIVPNPRDAEIAPAIRTIIQDLLRRPDFSISVVSGRGLEDLRERARLPGAILAGNHGLEIEGDDIRFREPEAEALRRELRCVTLQLQLALSETEGLELEDKGLTLAVHFRRVLPLLHDWVRSITFGAVARSKSFLCQEGKMVLDIRPRITWNKGHAVKWIANQLLPESAVAIYLGDDITDEDAFAELPEGITIKVGGVGETSAQYTLPDVPAVEQFLSWLSHAKPHEPLSDPERT